MRNVRHNSLTEMLEYKDLYPTEVIFQKAISSYEYVSYDKYRIPNKESNTYHTKGAATFTLRNKKAKIVNYIAHKDNSLTLITDDAYYLKFKNEL